MKYKITIIKLDTKKVVEEEWEKIADTGNEGDNGHVYGYVEKNTERKIEETILEQTLDDIDIPKVIKALNNLE